MPSIKQVDYTKECQFYFNWSCQAIIGYDPVAADEYLRTYRHMITKGAKFLLNKIGYQPTTIYRGLLMKQQFDVVYPHKNFTYLCFSTELSVAQHFADVHGFGSEYENTAERHGKYGYVITYTPSIDEVLFHHDLFDVLPYKKAFKQFGFDPDEAMRDYKKQKEVTIFQPAEPFTNVTKYNWPTT